MGAGIIQTKALQVGCLLRLEPNAQAQVSAEGGASCASHYLLFTHLTPLALYPLLALSSPQMYRLTLRTSKEPVSRHLCELLAQQF